MDDLITEDLKQILSKIVGQQATIQAIAIVKVLCATQGQQFEYANITGILCLIWDRERKAPFFRIFNPETFVLIFESEIYIDFADYYKKVNDQFYYFELVRGKHKFEQ
ncbi:hypothetical protein PPERSA_10427 [Pseudocohnilembus persalinus]|uniref:Uncharacterized protein n=1 Tax=Pseudocohnilembus persalinus TaxID=266149 RepID=A0A0V0QW04_PSEPJ|nr:hypothetical protein PPERSA_10427 [Pseudocohnilembus persalinus]|eukprot:KRX06569.1 hypothetical protein PPERSA_10427 [Pseudocohnilembus persalinus]